MNHYGIKTRHSGFLPKTESVLYVFWLLPLCGDERCGELMDGMLTKREGHSPCGRPPCCCIRALLPRTRLGFPLWAGPAWSQTGAARWWTRIDAQESEEGVRRQQGQTNSSGNGRYTSPGFHWSSHSYQLGNESFYATHVCNLTGQWNVSQVIWI